MYAYHQSSGKFYHDEQLIGIGYSGQPPHKNQGSAQNIPEYGPIPVGKYTIRPAFFHNMLGPLAMPLAPDPNNEMFGRGGFYIHGDSMLHPGMASHGCIILAHDLRKQIDAGTDRMLIVCS